MGRTGFLFVCALGAGGFLTPVLATEQVYHPISPTFGGNPNNGTFLLSTAQSQGEGTKSGNQGPTIDFPSTLFSNGSGGSGSGGTGSGGSGTGASGNGSGSNASSNAKLLLAVPTGGSSPMP